MDGRKDATVADLITTAVSQARAVAFQECRERIRLASDAIAIVRLLAYDPVTDTYTVRSDTLRGNNLDVSAARGL